MPASRAILGSLLAILSLSLSASAQVAGIQWHDDIGTATSLAQQTGKLVLVHFWAPGCAPCQVLEKQVFNQPHVAGAIEARFVPVKLNANEHPAVAQRFGLTSVPTDFILTPQGQVVGKMTSPNTPTTYVTGMMEAANRFAAHQRGGSNYPAVASQRSPVPQSAQQPPVRPQEMNPAYASLSINAPPLQSAAAAQNTYLPAGSPAAAVAGQRYASAGPATVNPGQAAGAAQQPAGQPSMQPRIQAAAAQTASMATSGQNSAPAAQTNPYAVSPSAPASATAATGSSAGPNPVSANAAPQVGANAANSTAGAGAANPQAGRQSSAGTPPLGFDGYCPVSMKRDWKWVPGDPRWGIQHRGRLYLFSSEAAKREFWNNPDFYSPVLSGLDPVLALDEGQYVEGLRQHSLEHEGLFYLFSSEETLHRFESNPQYYMAGVLQAMGTGGGATR